MKYLNTQKFNLIRNLINHISDTQQIHTRLFYFFFFNFECHLNFDSLTRPANNIISMITTNRVAVNVVCIRICNVIISAKPIMRQNSIKSTFIALEC